MMKKKSQSATETNKENKTPIKTIQFDVGGTVYKVSWSVIEAFPKTSLFRLAAKRGGRSPIFIDRNGDRFQYILDYMRDKEVHLPLSVSKAAILRDLEYFGFDNVNANTIHDGFESAQAATQIAKCEASYQKELGLCYERVRKLQLKITLLNVAHACFLSYTKTSNLTDVYLGDYSLNLMNIKEDVNGAFGSLNRDLFDECLAIHGLKYVSHRSANLRSNYSIWFYVSLAPLPQTTSDRTN